jgi:hypothetical protein
MGFSQMVDGVCFATTSAALTVNFIVKGVVWCNFYLFCIFAKSPIAADDII